MVMLEKLTVVKQLYFRSLELERGSNHAFIAQDLLETKLICGNFGYMKKLIIEIQNQ